MLKRTITVACLIVLSLASTALAAPDLQITDANTPAIMTSWRALNPAASWWPWSLNAADFDLDGDLDLFANTHAGHGGVILRNEQIPSGTLTFTNITDTLGLGTGLTATTKLPEVVNATVGDIYGNDGRPDLIGLNGALSSEAKHVQNASDTSFVVKTQQFTPVVDVTVGDINSDGWNDLVGFRYGVYVNGVYQKKLYKYTALNNQNGFAAETLVEVDPPADMPQSILDQLEAAKNFGSNATATSIYHTADLDGDGDQDRWLSWFKTYGVTSNEPLNRWGRYAINNGDGTYTDITASSGIPGTVTPILVEDLTGDGLKDVVTVVSTSYGSGDAGIYVNQGNNTFTKFNDTAFNSFFGTWPNYLPSAYTTQLDADPIPELVVVGNRGGVGSRIIDFDAGQFSIVASVDSWGGLWPIAIGDFNLDGNQDVALGLNPTGGSDGAIRFVLSQSAPPPPEASGVAGDYNNDGVVDAADYTVWRDHNGQAFQLWNEGATPGQVTPEDYDFWKTEFCNCGQSSAAIPEPSSFILLTIGLISFLR